MRKPSLLLGLLLGLGSLSAHAGLLFPTPAGSDVIKGRVVDSATGRPLVGVMVVAAWHDFTPDYTNFNIAGGGPIFSCHQLVNVLTTVSDADGNYEIPAWSGKWEHCKSMALGQPSMVLYKPGYAVREDGGVPWDKPFDAGPDFTKSPKDGRNFEMQPLSPYHTSAGGEDNHVQNLIRYASSIIEAFQNESKGPCFLDEERPVLLLLRQEQYRLAAYEAPGFDVMNTMFGVPMTDPRCARPEAMAAVDQEAKATPMDQPILPYIRNANTAPPSEEVFGLPKQWQDYLALHASAGHSDATKAIIYYVDVNPANPYYVAVLRDNVSNQEALGLDDPFGVPTTKELGNDGIHGFSCPLLGPIDEPDVYHVIWRVLPASVPADVSSRKRSVFNLIAAPRDRAIPLDPVHPGLMDGSPLYLDTVAPNGWHDTCKWVVALIPRPLPHAIIPMYEHRDTFDPKSGEWTLTDHSFVRLQEGSLPGVVEIHGTTSLHVSTELTPAGQDRWLLPPPGQAFSLSIEPVPNAFVAETKSAYAQKLSGVVTAALAKGERPFTKVQNLDGAKFVWYVFEKAGMGYPYATAHELRWSSLSFREEATPEDGDIAWWPDYVALVSMKPGEPMQFITAEAVIDDTVMETQRGKPRFYRREE